MASLSRKVYLHSLTESPVNGKLLHEFHVFDLNQKHNLDLVRNPSLPDDDSMISVAPVLRVDCRYVTVVPCILNSRIYFFPAYAENYNRGGRKTVRYHDLPSSPPAGGKPPYVRYLNNMKLGNPMCGPKVSPHAIPTPDGRKILVFSTLIKKKRRPEGCVDFELYDYVNGTSLQLPPLPDVPELSRLRDFHVDAYYFIDDTTFVVQTKAVQLMEFTLDLNSYQWKLSRDDTVIPHVLFEGFRVGGSFLLSRAGLYDMSRKHLSYKFPHNPNILKLFRPLMLAPVDNHPNRDPEICVLYVEFDGTDRVHPVVYINVHQINHATVFQEIPEENPEENLEERSSSGGGGGRKGRGRGKGRGGSVRAENLEENPEECTGKSGGRGGRVRSYSEPIPTRSRGYAFELRMPYLSFSPISLFPDRATPK